MEPMGFPMHVIRRCPVVCLMKICYTIELAELIMTLMTSELGAGQIATVIAKRTTAYWVSSARVYLEAQNHYISLDSERGSLSSPFHHSPLTVIGRQNLTNTRNSKKLI